MCCFSVILLLLSAFNECFACCTLLDGLALVLFDMNGTHALFVCVECFVTIRVRHNAAVFASFHILMIELRVSMLAFRALKCGWHALLISKYIRRMSKCVIHDCAKHINVKCNTMQIWLTIRLVVVLSSCHGARESTFFVASLMIECVV